MQINCRCAIGRHRSQQVRQGLVQRFKISLTTTTTTTTTTTRTTATTTIIIIIITMITTEPESPSSIIQKSRQYARSPSPQRQVETEVRAMYYYYTVYTYTDVDGAGRVHRYNPRFHWQLRGSSISTYGIPAKYDMYYIGTSII
jgi:hypothetical protein